MGERKGQPARQSANDATKPVRACPICGKPSVELMKPFCSKRCADVDLHRWLSGSYAIPVEEPAPGDPAAAEDDD